MCFRYGVLCVCTAVLVVRHYFRFFRKYSTAPEFSKPALRQRATFLATSWCENSRSNNLTKKDQLFRLNPSRLTLLSLTINSGLTVCMQPPADSALRAIMTKYVRHSNVSPPSFDPRWSPSARKHRGSVGVAQYEYLTGRVVMLYTFPRFRQALLVSRSRRNTFMISDRVSCMLRFVFPGMQGPRW